MHVIVELTTTLRVEETPIKTAYHRIAKFCKQLKKTLLPFTVTFTLILVQNSFVH